MHSLIAKNVHGSLFDVHRKTQKNKCFFPEPNLLMYHPNNARLNKSNKFE